MDNLNNIPSQGNFGNFANVLNQNFATIKVAIGQIEYSTTKCRGMYASATALGNVVTHPKVGDWALVGQSFPAAIYVCNTADTWTNSGNTYSGDNVSFNDCVKQAEFTSYKDATDDRLDTLEGHFASGGVVAGHSAAISQIYNGITDLNEANDQRISEINDLQDDLNTPNTGLKDRMTEAEENINTIYSGVEAHDTSLGGHETAIHDLQADVRYIRASIDMIGPGSGGGTGLSIQALTQEAYDALETKDATTLYMII